MTAAVLALALVAAIIIVPAIVARRSSAGHRRLRDHHRALDTLGQITATQPDGSLERARSGYTASQIVARPSAGSRSGLATDNAGPQAHVRVVSPNAQIPRPLTGEGRMTGSTAASRQRRDSFRSEATPDTAVGDHAVEGEWTGPSLSPPPEEYRDAGQPTDPGDATGPDEPAVEQEPGVDDSVPYGSVQDEPVLYQPLLHQSGAPETAVHAPDSHASGVDASVPGERPRGAFPGADPTVAVWTLRQAGGIDTVRHATGPSFPESDPSAAELITAPVPVTAEVEEDHQAEEERQAEVDGEAFEPDDESGIAQAGPEEVADRPVWRPVQAATDRPASPFGPPRVNVDGRRRHRRRSARRTGAKTGRVVGGLAAVIVVAAGGVVAFHDVSRPSAKPRTAASAPPSTSVGTTATTPPSSAPPRSTTVPAVTKAPFKLVSSSPGISVYRIVGRPRITVTATGECWTEILRRNATGRTLYVQTMVAGTRHEVKGPVWIRLGDPTAVTITVNGTKVTPPVSNGDPYDVQFE
jgi:hypothetical protein